MPGTSAVPRRRRRPLAQSHGPPRRRRMSKPATVRGWRAGRLLVLAAMVLSMLGVTQLASAGPNPPGNNGTVKIDDIPVDDHPDNQPHVGCQFQVDFYDYDEGDLDAT